MSHVRMFVSVFCGIVLLLLMAFQYKLFSDFQGLGETVDETVTTAALNDIEIRGLKNSSTKKLYDALINPNQFFQDRYIYVEEQYRIKDLLNKGEAAPDSDFIEAFAALRAGQLSEQECDLLKQEIASECKVQGSSSEHRDGLITISYNLAFKPKSNFGEVKAVTAAVFSHNEKDMADITLSVSGPAEIRKFRQKQYSKIAETCSVIKSKVGNCGVSRARISTYIGEKNTIVRGQALAVFAHIAPL
jgi:hypothetical protein